jgi:DNA-binding NtrC family response regulator
MADTQTSRVFGANFQGTPQAFELEENLRLQRVLSPVHLLVVDDDEQVREVCRTVAEECGLKVVDVGTGEEALEVMEISSVDVLLTDLRLPGTSGLDLLRKVSVTHPDIAVVMLTQYGTIDSAVEATRLGAADYVTKPSC